MWIGHIMETFYLCSKYEHKGHILDVSLAVYLSVYILTVCVEAICV